MKKELTRETVEEACKNSLTMAEASRKLDLHYNTFTKYAKKFGCFNPNPSGKGTTKVSGTKFDLNDIITGLYPDYQTLKLKKRLINEGIKSRICENCNNTEWLGNPIPLELHHKDGNSRNHLLDNLQLLCPNCHTTTDTYRGKTRI